jgi:hypothetical protein
MNKNLQLSIEQFIYFELYSSHIVSILGSSNKESKKKKNKKSSRSSKRVPKG